MSIIIIQAERGMVDEDILERILGFKPGPSSEVFLTECGPDIIKHADNFDSAILVGECIFSDKANFSSMQYVDPDGDVISVIEGLVESQDLADDSVGTDQSEVNPGE
jgi:hypothetical protein